MTKNPQISIIVRTYNSEAFVKKAIESVLSQTINLELLDILVIDDGSTDNTQSILDSFNNKIRVLEQPHGGARRAANFGFSSAKGKYVILLDADDTLEPTILEKMFKVFENEGDISFVYCDYYEKDTRGDKAKKVSLENIFNSLAGGIMFKKEIIIEMGGYKESMFFPEYDLLIKIMKKYRGWHIKEPLFTYIRHSGSMTTNKKNVKRGMDQLFKKYGNIKIREY